MKEQRRHMDGLGNWTTNVPLSLWPRRRTLSRLPRLTFRSSRSALRASSICSLIFFASASLRSRVRRCSGVSLTGGAVNRDRGSKFSSNERPIWMRDNGFWGDTALITDCPR